jgi:hypothetical protein
MSIADCFGQASAIAYMQGPLHLPNTHNFAALLRAHERKNSPDNGHFALTHRCPFAILRGALIAMLPVGLRRVGVDLRRPQVIDDVFKLQSTKSFRIRKM